MINKLKNPNRLALFCALLLFALAGCKKDEVGPSVVQELIGKEWRVQSVLSSAQDWSHIYDGFELTFDLVNDRQVNFTAINGMPIWEGSGQLLFEGAKSSAFTLLGSNQVFGRVRAVNDSKLEIEIDWPWATLGPGGRVKSVAGIYTFVFTAN
jgi:hypothetical protein